MSFEIKDESGKRKAESGNFKPQLTRISIQLAAELS